MWRVNAHSTYENISALRVAVIFSNADEHSKKDFICCFLLQKQVESQMRANEEWTTANLVVVGSIFQATPKS